VSGIEFVKDSPMDRISRSGSAIGLYFGKAA